MPAKLKYFAVPGEEYGRWFVIGTEVVLNARRKRCVLCRCQGSPDRPCGTERLVKINDLVSGHSRSCGCLSSDTTSAMLTVHGHARRGRKPPEYQVWQDMKKRCYDPKNVGFQNYGGRGIRVCDRWLNSFEKLLADMGPRPSPKHTIDRKDPNGDYTPENCRWATKKEQSRNRRNVRRWTIDGETHCPGEWAEIMGLKWATLHHRAKRSGRINEALLAPVPTTAKEQARTRKDLRMLTVNGETRPLVEWAEISGLPMTTLGMRWFKGWPPERMLEPRREVKPGAGRKKAGTRADS